MAGYDETKDLCVADLGTHGIDAKTNLEIGIYQYNGGAKKVRVTRVTLGKGRDYRKAAGSFTKKEFEEVLGLGPLILEHLK